jgi:hypothetical protein
MHELDFVVVVVTCCPCSIVVLVSVHVALEEVVPLVQVSPLQATLL